LNNGSVSSMGQESIRVYGLMRPQLIWARSQRLIIIKAQVKLVNQYIRRLDEDPDDEEVKKSLKLKMEELDKMLEDDQPYAGIARQYVKTIFGG